VSLSQAATLMMSSPTLAASTNLRNQIDSVRAGAVLLASVRLVCDARTDEKVFGRVRQCHTTAAARLSCMSLELSP
jgi:hypothetical protein